MDPLVNAALMAALIPLQASVKTDEFTSTFEKLPFKPRKVWESCVALAQPSYQIHVPRLKALSGRGCVALEAVRINCYNLLA